MTGFVIGVITTIVVWTSINMIRAIHRANVQLREKADKAKALVNVKEPENGVYFNIVKAMSEIVNPTESCVMCTGSLANEGEIYIEHLVERIKKHPHLWRLYFQI